MGTISILLSDVESPEVLVEVQLTIRSSRVFGKFSTIGVQLSIKVVFLSLILTGSFPCVSRPRSSVVQIRKSRGERHLSTPVTNKKDRY